MKRFSNDFFGFACAMLIWLFFFSAEQEPGATVGQDAQKTRIF